MLRLLIVLLVLANGLYFAWSQGHLAAWGLGPSSISEPQRLEQQIKPGAIRLISPKEAKTLENQASRPKECLQSELLTEAQAQSLRARIEAAQPAWPVSSWSIEKYVEVPTWIIFMGPYPNAGVMDKKKQELRRMGVSFDSLKTRPLGDGLMLASGPDKAALDQQLASLSKAGVRTARVVSLRTQGSGWVLKLPQVTDELKLSIDAIRPQLPVLVGAGLRKCVQPS